MGGHSKEAKKAAPAKTWRQAAKQPRVREQWDAVKLAHKLLDDMDRGGRLHGKKNYD